MKRKEKITALVLIVVGSVGILLFGGHHLANYLHDPYAHIERVYIEQGETVKLNSDALAKAERYQDLDGTFWPPDNSTNWNGTIAATIPRDAELFDSLEDAGIDPRKMKHSLDVDKRILIIYLTLESIDAVPRSRNQEGNLGYNISFFNAGQSHIYHLAEGSMAPDSPTSGFWFELNPGEEKTFKIVFYLDPEDTLPTALSAGQDGRCKYYLNFDIIDHTKGSDS